MATSTITWICRCARAIARAERRPPRHFRFPRFGGKSDPPPPTRTSTLTPRASRVVQGVTQGPYPWESMDQWLIAKFISLDLMVNRAGESGWITLGDMVARRRAEAQGARSLAAAGATGMPPPPPKRDDASAARAGSTRAPGVSAPFKTRYTEPVDDRVARMIRQGKFGPEMTRLATGGELAVERDESKPKPETDAAKQTRGKRKAPSSARDDHRGDGDRDGDRDRERDGDRDGDKRRRRREGYEQLPVFAPSKPVAIPTVAAEGEDAPKDPRERSESRGEADLFDGRLPEWSEEASARRRAESDFDRGGPPPAAEPKAEDSDGGDSDVSWSALPGAFEDPELVKERRLARKRERLEAERASAEAAHAAAKNASVERTSPTANEKTTDPAIAAAAEAARDPRGGAWRVPSARDAWRWTAAAEDAAAEEEERLDALEARLASDPDAPRRCVARRAADDSFRVASTEGADAKAYGDAVRGAKAKSTGARGGTSEGGGGGASEAREGACARVMAALFDAAMKNRRRVFFELVAAPLEAWREERR